MPRTTQLYPALHLSLLCLVSAHCTAMAAPAADPPAADPPSSYLLTRLAQLPEYSPGAAGARLYGTLDLGLMASRTRSGPTTWQQQSGGASTSKLGVYVAEDLDSDLRVDAKLEAGLQADTGAQQANALFNRESWVGLRSRRFGTLRFGNQINAMLPLFIDPFLLVPTNSAYTWVAGGAMQTARGVGANTDLGPGAGTIPVRVPKAITYATPRWMGLAAQAIVAANATGAQVPKLGTRGAVVSFGTGTVYLATSLTQTWSNPVVATAGQTAQPVRTDIGAAGAIYDTGKLVLSASYARIAPQLAQGGVAQVRTLGLIAIDGRLAWRASLVQRTTDGARSSAGVLVASSALGLMLGADYDLSPRTSLYARAGSVRNAGASTIILNSVPLPLVAGSTAPQTGIETRTLSVGLAHHF
jgi:predicted porin